MKYLGPINDNKDIVTKEYVDNKTIVDNTLSLTSKNSVQNKVIAAALNEKALTIHSHNSLVPMQSKSYEGIYATDTSQSNSNFYFGTVKPNTWTDVWHIKYRIKAYIPGQTNYMSDSIVEFWGCQTTKISYSNFNNIFNTSYRPMYYHLLYSATSTGNTNGYGHLIGAGLRNSTNPTSTSYKRTVDIDILEQDNCTFNFFDSMTKFTSVPGTGSTNYNGLWETDGYNNGLRETGDVDSTDRLSKQSSRVYAGSSGIYGYQIIMEDSVGKYQSICTSCSINTNKTCNTTGFRIDKMFLYYGTSATISANNLTGTWTIYETLACDFRYSSNCGSTLTAYKSVYLIGTIKSDGLFYLKTTGWYTQTLPTTDDGYMYVYIGEAYSTTAIYFSINHDIYQYKNGKVQIYHNGRSTEAEKLATARKINGVNFDGTEDITISSDNKIYLTLAEYTELLKSGEIDDDAEYVTIDEMDNISSSDIENWNNKLSSDGIGDNIVVTEDKDDKSNELNGTMRLKSWFSRIINTIKGIQLLCETLSTTKINTSDIVNNLASTDTDKPLSANQGKVLNTTKINTSDIVDNLVSTDTNKPLSANQGKVLNDNKITKSDLLNFVYPVGSIYMSVNNTSPGTFLGGTWVAWGAGRVPLSVNSGDTDFSTAEKTGGAKTVNLSHTHTNPNTGAASGNTGATTGSTAAASGNTGSTTLTVSQIPAHGHVVRLWNKAGVTDQAYTWTNNGLTHSRTSAGLQVASSAGSWVNSGLVAAQSGQGDQAGQTDTAGGGGGHTHTLNSHTHSVNSHTHTLNSHTHTVGATRSAGSATQTIVQPYITCYMWKRTA